MVYLAPLSPLFIYFCFFISFYFLHVCGHFYPWPHLQIHRSIHQFIAPAAERHRLLEPHRHPIAPTRRNPPHHREPPLPPNTTVPAAMRFHFRSLAQPQLDTAPVAAMRRPSPPRQQTSRRTAVAPISSPRQLHRHGEAPAVEEEEEEDQQQVELHFFGIFGMLHSVALSESIGRQEMAKQQQGLLWESVCRDAKFDPLYMM